MKIWIRQTTDFVRATTERVAGAVRAYDLATSLAILSILTATGALVLVTVGTAAALDAIPALGLNATAAQALADDTAAWGDVVRALIAGSGVTAALGVVALLPAGKPLRAIAAATEPLRYADPGRVVRVALPEGEEP